MKIAYITAGAGGTICGNCLRDNTLARALIDLGHEVQLIPTYTPIRTDEQDVSSKRVFLGGLKIYLQQVLPALRFVPRPLSGLLDRPELLRWISRFAVSTRPEELGAMTVGVLEGETGPYRREFDPLVDWLAAWQPDVVHITNSMLAGVAPMLKKRLRSAVVCSLQGEDLFLSSMPSPYRERAFALLPELAGSMDVFVSPSRAHAEEMAGHLAVHPDKVPVVHSGIDLVGYAGGQRRAVGEFVVGYLARVAPEKGLRTLAKAVAKLRAMNTFGRPRIRLRVAGWLTPEHRSFLGDVERQVQDDGFAEDFEYVGEVDREQKIAFLKGLDVLSVPTCYGAPKGLYVMEAWACGVPVVQPRIGVFPELIDATGGGLLCEPGDAADLAKNLEMLMTYPEMAEEMGALGRRKVQDYFHSKRMAGQMLTLYENLTPYRERRL